MCPLHEITDDDLTVDESSDEMPALEYAGSSRPTTHGDEDDGNKCHCINCVAERGEDEGTPTIFDKISEKRTNILGSLMVKDIGRLISDYIDKDWFTVVAEVLINNMTNPSIEDYDDKSALLLIDKVRKRLIDNFNKVLKRMDEGKKEAIKEMRNIILKKNKFKDADPDVIDRELEKILAKVAKKYDELKEEVDEDELIPEIPIRTNPYAIGKNLGETDYPITEMVDILHEIQMGVKGHLSLFLKCEMNILANMEGVLYQTRRHNQYLNNYYHDIGKIIIQSALAKFDLERLFLRAVIYDDNVLIDATTFQVLWPSGWKAEYFFLPPYEDDEEPDYPYDSDDDDDDNDEDDDEGPDDSDDEDDSDHEGIDSDESVHRDFEEDSYEDYLQDEKEEEEDDE
jgi:hypothetical protein